MAVTKKPISVTLDCDVYEAAKNKYNNIVIPQSYVR